MECLPAFERIVYWLYDEFPDLTRCQLLAVRVTEAVVTLG